MISTFLILEEVVLDKYSSVILFTADEELFSLLTIDEYFSKSSSSTSNQETTSSSSRISMISSNDGRDFSDASILFLLC